MVFSRELPHSFGDALRVARGILSSNRELVRKGVVEVEAEQIVIGAHRQATGEKLSRASFFASLPNRLPESTAERLLILAGQRAEGVLLQHLLGYQAFLDHEYEVNDSTLVPRPETEVLVREAIQVLHTPKLGLEIGLGTGVISIELLHAFTDLRMVATEISGEAIALAQRNADRVLGSTSRLEAIRPEDPTQVLESFSDLKTRAEFLISNPPYLDRRDLSEADAEVLAQEPESALFPPCFGNPLYFYEKIATCAADFLVPSGQVFLEIAAERADATLALFTTGWKARLVNDLTGRPRVLVAERK